MKLKFFIFSFLISLCSFINAQTKGTIVDELIQRNHSGGTITITCNPQINALLGKPVTEITTNNETYVKIPGYKVQAFSGNQRQSKEEAFSKAKEIKDLFPETATYVTYKAPIWRLRVGDFQTNEEASSFMKSLKKKLPSMEREMYIVADEIKVVL